MSNKNKLLKSFNYFKDIVKDQDMFGQPIKLNFKSKTETNTCVGALLSIFIKVFVFCCFIIKGVKLVGNTERTLE